MVDYWTHGTCGEGRSRHSATNSCPHSSILLFGSLVILEKVAQQIIRAGSSCVQGLLMGLVFGPGVHKEALRLLLDNVSFFS